MILSRSHFPFLAFLLIFSCRNGNDPYRQWNVYNGTKESLHYSALTQIDTGNADRLEVAWIYHTGDADTAAHSQIQCNPIVVNGIMYVTSPQLRLIALDAATGEKKWVFDPDSLNMNIEGGKFGMNNNRGVTYWEEEGDKRIFYVAGSSLYAVNAVDGKSISSFGKNGSVDLHDGYDLNRDVSRLYITATSPGIIYKDLLILGSRVDEAPPSAPGYVKAYDTRSGKIRWIFHTIPQPGEFGFDSWEDSLAWKHTGGANCWSGMSLDEKRGIVYIPLGSASYDFYGGKRKGANLFANCLLALEAATGKYIWHFQSIHHDLWDKDLPAPPALLTVERNGKKVDVVAQTTKNGFVFVLNRETGEPIYPIEEMPVDTAYGLTGESLWPTQPIAKIPAPFVRQVFAAEDINPYLPDTSVTILKEALKSYRFGNMFIPPGTRTSVIFPGFDGGGEWGGPAADPETGMLYVNANEMGWLMEMQKVPPLTTRKENYLMAGQRLYNQHCMSCHGADRKGTGNYPSVAEMNKKYKTEEMMALINDGRRMMPSFKYFSEEEKNALSVTMLDQTDSYHKAFHPPKRDNDSFQVMPFKMKGYIKFLSPEGFPAIKPPWGTISAINLNTGEHAWKTTLGEYPELKAQGIPPTGTENYGGPVATAGGLLIIAAARDSKIRILNKRTGKLLWEHDLPAPGFATPAVYSVNGKQYIVIACGGGKLNTRSSDAYVAFALRTTN